jgi:hypothetical protein
MLGVCWCLEIKAVCFVMAKYYVTKVKDSESNLLVRVLCLNEIRSGDRGPKMMCITPRARTDSDMRMDFQFATVGLMGHGCSDTTLCAYSYSYREYTQAMLLCATPSRLFVE